MTNQPLATAPRASITSFSSKGIPEKDHLLPQGKMDEGPEQIVWRLKSDPSSPWLPILLTSIPRGRVSRTLQEMTSNSQRDPAEVPPKSFRTQSLHKRTEREVALTCKGHDGVFPQGAQLLLTAGFTGDILGAGEVHHQQCEAGRQQGDSQGSREHHGGPLCAPSSWRRAGGRPAMQTLTLTTCSLGRAHLSRSPPCLSVAPRDLFFCLFK